MGGSTDYTNADAARAAIVRAYDDARAAQDVDAMATAAIGLASRQVYGAFPGRIPAYLFEAYSLTQGVQRAQLAVAITKVWAYSGEAARAVPFADEAMVIAESSGQPSLIAEALDAALLVRWGPDDLAERLRITTKLEDTVAHLDDVEAQLSAHLWRLTTALECLDVGTARRQLRALSLLAEESGSARVRFFAASRRGMYALLVNDLAGAEAALVATVAAGEEAGEPDTVALNHTLTSRIALQSGDLDTLATEAASYEEYGVNEGVVPVAAEAASLWFEAGQPDHARRLLLQLAGEGRRRITRDVDWLLTVSSLAKVAAALGEASLCGAAVDLLEPYAGRGVSNGGAVVFEGVVDDFLGRAALVLGRDADAANWLEASRRAYEQMGAEWLLAQLPKAAAASAPASWAGSVSSAVELRPGDGGIWWVGAAGHSRAIRDMKGLHYLRLLIESPGVDLSAQTLSDVAAGHPSAAVNEPSLGPLIDRQALVAYRRRLVDLDDDLDEATRNADHGRVAAISAERDALLDQLRSATGLGGRPRLVGASHERARVAVRKAIASAIDRITVVAPEVGEVLRRSVVTGTMCRYDPDPARPIEWDTALTH